MVYAKDRTPVLFRTYPDVLAYLNGEARRRGVSRNEVMNEIVREHRDGVKQVASESGDTKEAPIKPWWAQS